MNIQVKILNKEFYSVSKMGGEYYDLPTYQTFGSAAMDLVCTEDVTIYPGETKAINTGLAIWIGSDYARTNSCEPLSLVRNSPIGFVDNENIDVAGLILPRSGLGTKGLILANTIGLIDEDYQGELIVQAWNRQTDKVDIVEDCHYDEWITYTDITPGEAIELKAGDRFAQLMFVPVIKAKLEIVEDFNNNTQRGALGFGSTGI